MGYQCAKDTSRTLPAIVLAAIVNIVCNFFLVQRFGVYGAIATSIITYLVLFLYRLHDMKRYFKLSFYPSTTIAVILILVGAVPFHLLDKWWALMLYMIAACAMAYFAIPKESRDEMNELITQKISSLKQ
jgi:O-antigen/teichoic acid export membrane protein